MKTALKISAFAAAALLACVTEPCACPPATSMFLIYGKVLRANGEPVANAAIVAKASRDAACVFDNSEFVDLYPQRAQGNGNVRSSLRLLSGSGSHCIRLVAYAGLPGASDSTVLPEMIVQFRLDRETPDSLGLIFRLP